MIKCQSFTWGVCTNCNNRIKVEVGSDLSSISCPKCEVKEVKKPVKRRATKKTTEKAE